MHAYDLFVRVRDDLRAQATDQEWSDLELYRRLDRAYLKVWGEQVTLFESWQVKRATIDVVASTELYSLPVDCKKIVMIEYMFDSLYYPIKNTNYRDLFQYSSAANFSFIDMEEKRYYELDSQIGIVPTPVGAVTAGIRVTYYPHAGHLHSGLVAAVAGTGPTTTVTLATGASTDDDAYNGQYLHIVSGTGAGQKALISDYVGATKVATVVFATAPTTASVYAVHPKSERELDELIILQTCRDCCVRADPAGAKIFAELYAIERKRRVDELEQRNLEPRMVRFIDPNV
jgi:hypothetical protein